MEIQIGSFMQAMIAIGHERSESGPTSALDRKSVRVRRGGWMLLYIAVSRVCYANFSLFSSSLQEWNAYWQNRKANDEELKNIEDPNSPEAQKLRAKYKEVSVDCQ